MMVPVDSRLADICAGVEHSVDGVFVGAPDGRVLYANPAGRDLLGGSPEELTASGHGGTTCADQALWESLFEDRRRTGSLKGIAPVCRLDGTVFWAGVSSTMFTAEDDRELTLWIVRNVTPRVQMVRQLEAYDLIAEALLAGQPTAEVLDLVAQHSCYIFDAAFAAIVTPEPDGLGVIIAAAAGVGSSELAGRAFPPGGLSESVMSAAAPRLIDDISAMTRTGDVRSLGLRSGMIVPIVAGEAAIGTLFIGAGPQRPQFDADDLAMAKAFAARAGIALAFEAARSAADRARSEVTSQLQQALDSRVLIEQAKGFISCLRDIGTEEAFQRLRNYARSHNTDLHSVAGQIVRRELIL